MYIRVRLHVNFPLFLTDFNATSIFSLEFRKQIRNFMKILPVGAELFPAAVQTDVTKLQSLFGILREDFWDGSEVRSCV